MNGWFTVEKIDAQTFAISEYRHWEETHCYLLCGQDKSALIDTGLGVSNIQCVVDRLTTLPVTVLTTHVHWDHIGGHGLFDRIAVHEAEKDWIDGGFPLPLNEVKEQLQKRPVRYRRSSILTYTGSFRGNRRFYSMMVIVLTWAEEQSGCCTRRDILPGTVVFTNRREGICIPAIWCTKAVWTPFIRALTRCFFISQ